MTAGILIASCTGIGAAAGFCRRLTDTDLFASIDRRAGLKDRLSTADEVSAEQPFAAELQADARAAFAGIEPKRVFPALWQWRDTLFAAPALSGVVLVAWMLLPPQLSPEKQQERQAMSRKEEELQRISAPAEKASKEGRATEAEERLIQEVQRLRQDLRNLRSDPERALEKANELQSRAEQSANFRKEQTLQSLASASQATAEMALSALEKQQSLSPSELTAIRQQIEAQSKSQRNLAEKASEIRRQIEQIDRQLRDESLSPQERAELEGKREQLAEELAETEAQSAEIAAQNKANLQELQSQIQELQAEQLGIREQLNQTEAAMQELRQQMQQDSLSAEQKSRMMEEMKKLQELRKKLGQDFDRLADRLQQLSNQKAIQEMLEKLNNHPGMQELREMAQELEQNAESGELTQEQLQEMLDRMDELQKQLEELAEQLQDPEALEEFMRQKREALENAQMGQSMSQLGLSLGMGFGLVSTAPMPTPLTPEDRMDTDTGRVNKSDRDKDIKDRAIPTGVKGQRQDRGSEAFIEVRGPTGVGNRTSVPYRQVLPSYRKRAEKAVANQKIPKQHEKRVKRYFDSLGGNP